jgi:iron complex transport system substrate-binding protein
MDTVFGVAEPAFVSRKASLHGQAQGEDEPAPTTGQVAAGANPIWDGGISACVLAATILLLLSGTASARTVKDQTGRSVNVPDHPHRLVSLAPNITEIVYALGLGDELVGDTDYCDFPPEAKKKPHVGTMLNPSLERIVALKPDLALGTPEANRRETADQLERLGIPLYGVTASTLPGTLASIEDLGRILGRETEARALAAALQARIGRVQKRIEGEPKPKVLYVVWYRPLITVGPRTFIADVIRAAGGIPVGENLKGEWPRLSLEELLPQNPAVILLPRTESFSASLDELRSLPGWKELQAVKEGRMYLVSEAIERPSPRLVDALEQVADILHPERRP